jgi:hypothetical protein
MAETVASTDGDQGGSLGGTEAAAAPHLHLRVPDSLDGLVISLPPPHNPRGRLWFQGTLQLHGFHSRQMVRLYRLYLFML